MKFVKGLKVKVQSQVQGDQVRITGKTKDDLQVVMKAVKEHDFDIAAAVHELPAVARRPGSLPPAASAWVDWRTQQEVTP